MADLQDKLRLRGLSPDPVRDPLKDKLQSKIIQRGILEPDVLAPIPGESEIHGYPPSSVDIDLGRAAQYSLDLSTPGAPRQKKATETLAQRINVAPDPDEKWRNELFTSRGITLPAPGQILNTEYNKWAQRYQLDLEHDPIQKNVFSEIQADPAAFVKFRQPWQKANRVLYQIQKTPPSPDETLASFTDAMQTWAGSTKLNAFNNKIGAPSSLPPGFDYAQLLDIYKRYSTRGMAGRKPNDFSWLAPDEQKLVQAAGGESALVFFGAHQDYFVARGRLERLTGMPIERDKPFAVAEGQLGELLSKTFDDLEGVKGTYRTTVPFEPNFHYSALARTIPEIGEMTALYNQRRQDALQAQNAQHAPGDPTRQALQTGLPTTAAQGALEGIFNPAAARLRDERQQAEMRALMAGATPQDATAAYQSPFSGPASGLAGVLDRAYSSPAAYVFTGIETGLETLGHGINAITFGIIPRLTETIRDTGRMVSWALTGDERNYDAKVDAMPKLFLRAFARGLDEKSTDKLARYDQAWRDLFPTGDPLASSLNSLERINAYDSARIIMNRNVEAPWGLGAFAKAMGVSTPEAQVAMGNILSQTDDGTSFLMNFVGIPYLAGLLRGKGPLPPLKTPGNRYLAIDRAVNQSGRFSPVPTAARTMFLEAIERELGKVKTPEHLRGLMRRLDEELAGGRGPMDPPLTAATILKIQDFRRAASAQVGDQFTPAVQYALTQLPPALENVGVMDGLYVASGDSVRTGPHVSAAESANLHAVARMIEADPRTPAPRLLQNVIDYKDSYAKALIALTRRRENLDWATQRRRTITRILGLLEPQLVYENYLSDLQSRQLRSLRTQTIQQYHQDLLQTFDKFKKFEVEGGERQRPNHMLYKQVYRHLNDMVTNGLFSSSAKIKELLAKHSSYVRLVAGEEASELSKGLRSSDDIERLTSERRFAQLVTTWLDDNAKPGFEQVPPNANPRLKLIDSMETALAPARDPTAPKAVIPSPEHLEALNSIQGIKFNPKILSERLKALEQDVNTANKNIQSNALLLQESAAFRDYIDKLDPLKPGTPLKVKKEFRDLVAQKLGSPAWLVRQDKFHLSLFADAEALTTGNLSALEAWFATIKDLGEDARLLREGRIQAGALDYAVMGLASRPNEFYWTLQNQQRIAQNVINEYRFDALELNKILEKDLTPAQHQQLMIDLRNNNQQNPYVPIVRQKAYMKWLTGAYKSGQIPLETFQKFAANTHYYHGVFTREELARMPPLQRPSKYSTLRVTSTEFNFRIPEESWYAAWRGKKGAILHYPHYDDGPKFLDQAAAESWVEMEQAKPDSQIPAGAEIAVHPPWTFGEKEAAGLVVDAGTSTLDLADRMGLGQAQATINRAISQTHFALTPDQFLARNPGAFDPAAPRHTVDANGTQWFWVNDPRATHLNKKFVSEQVVSWMQYSNMSYGWWEELARQMHETRNVLAPYAAARDNPLMRHYVEAYGSHLSLPGGFAALLGKPSTTPGLPRTLFLTIPGNVLGVSKIALSYRMPVTQAATNFVVSLPSVGLYPWTPYGGASMLRFGAEAHRSWLKPGKDLYWQRLFAENSIHVSRTTFEAAQAKAWEENLQSVAGLHAQLARADQHVLDTASDPVKQAQALLHKTDLENQLQLANRKAQGGLISKLLSGAGDWLKKLAKGLTTGESTITDGLYSWVSYFDNVSKYIGLRHLVENRGMHMDDAMAYVKANFQHLHQVPQPIKLLSQTLGGSKFTTFPFDMARISSNLMKNQPLWLLGHMGTLAAWNFAAIAANHQDPTEKMNAWAAINHREPGWVSKAQFLLSRIQLPPPYSNNAISLDSVWGFLNAKSQIGKEAVKMTRTSNLPDAMKTALEGAIGFGSKFAAGQFAISVYNQRLTGRDYRGNPLPTAGDHLKALASSILPDYTPLVGRDYLELRNWAGTSYLDVRSGEQKSFGDYALNAFFQKIPSDELSDPALLRAVMSAHLGANPQRVQQLNSVSYDQTLRYALYSGGAIRDDGLVDLTKAKPIFDDWAATRAGERFLIGPEEFLKREYTPAEKQALIETATAPTMISGFRILHLVEQIPIYAKLNQINPQLNVDLKHRLGQIINSKVVNSALDMASVENQMLPALKTWSETPDLPPDVKQQMQSWYNQANLNSVRRLINTAAPGTMPTQPTAPRPAVTVPGVPK